MSSNEIDYDQTYTASIKQSDAVWLYPPQDLAHDIADGYAAVVHMLSIGPFDIAPGADLSLAFAFAAGEDLHIDPGNGSNLPDNPKAHHRNLDFSDLVKNAVWARWIYDNPGIDTDGDGYAGEFHVCALESTLVDSQWITTATDTFYYKGDGVPDWRAAGPPPAPQFWLEPTVGGIRVRFNGSRSETEKDIFTKIVDFEGYRIYLGRDDRESSLSLVASYDRHNYDRYVLNPVCEEVVYEAQDIPFTLDSLRCLYSRSADPCNDTTFDPLKSSRSFPYTLPGFPDSMCYFLPHDHNASELGVTTPIRKVYPDEPDPTTLPPGSLTPDHYTDDGHLKYFEYEFTIENLLPTVPYWVNVTAFDFGSPESGLHPLETSVTVGSKSAFPLSSEDQAAGENLRVYIYPNPYRIDASYRARGYEGRTRDDRSDDRVRAIHFANLPSKCTISIYSLDCDLVRRLDHDIDPSDPNYSHDEWNLITRNTQAPVSGLYYWVVEAADGSTQMGKLVIIM